MACGGMGDSGGGGGRLNLAKDNPLFGRVWEVVALIFSRDPPSVEGGGGGPIFKEVVTHNLMSREIYSPCTLAPYSGSNHLSRGVNIYNPLPPIQPHYPYSRAPNLGKDPCQRGVYPSEYPTLVASSIFIQVLRVHTYLYTSRRMTLGINYVAVGELEQKTPLPMQECGRKIM